MTKHAFTMERGKTPIGSVILEIERMFGMDGKTSGVCVVGVGTMHMDDENKTVAFGSKIALPSQECLNDKNFMEKYEVASVALAELAVAFVAAKMGNGEK